VAGLSRLKIKLIFQTRGDFIRFSASIRTIASLKKTQIEKALSLKDRSVIQEVVNPKVSDFVMDMTKQRAGIFMSFPVLERNLDNVKLMIELSRLQLKLLKRTGGDPSANLKSISSLTKPEVSKALISIMPKVEAQPNVPGVIGNAAIVFNRVFQEAMVTTLICRDIAPKFSHVTVSYNGTKAVCNAAPVLSKAIVQYASSKPLMLLTQQALHGGMPQDIWSAATFSMQCLSIYAIPKTLSYFGLSGFGVSLMLAAGAILVTVNSSESKSATDVLYDMVVFNSSPLAIGIISMEVMVGIMSVPFLPAMAIGTGLALTADYAWTAYEKEDLLVLPSSISFIYDSIFE
jgi:hypothetical protein